MLGTALQFGSVRGEDRFYIPVKARKNQNQRKQAQRAKNGEIESADSTPKSKVDASENNNNPNESLYLSTKPSLCSSVESVNNIDRFLESTTPLVPAQYFSKTTMRGWKTCDVEYQSYFTLNDLWESFKEWSAYGAGVPLLLDQSVSVVQYFVPYLSAIQLYGQSADKSSVKPRLSVHDKHNTIQEGFSIDDSEIGNPQDLLFEYFEQDPPYSREPLADKILDLADHYPGFKSLRSCDLLPASWMSVAWYPIYRIPTGPTLKDLDACFLTYHTLHTPMTGSGRNQAPILVSPNEMDGVPKISLPTFAMAAYKLKGSIWIKKEVGESQIVNSLLQAADNWLRLLQVNHPDYQFFKSHGTYHR